MYVRHGVFQKFRIQFFWLTFETLGEVSGGKSLPLAGVTFSLFHMYVGMQFNWVVYTTYVPLFHNSAM